MRASLKLLIGYLICCIVGFILLSFPGFQSQDVNSIDNIFVAVSSISTTGLIPFQLVENYNLGGQIIILLLIQIGGIGFMSIAAYIIHRMNHKWESDEKELIEGDLGLPPHYNLFTLVKIKLFLALIVETIGTIVLFFIFKDLGIENALWNAIFHSVSAFCTAGMSLFSNGLENFTTHYGINFTIGILCYIGSIGFIVFADLWQLIQGKRKSLTFTSRIILKYSSIFIVIGIVVFFTLEPAIQGFSTSDKLFISFFHVISASSTAGFNTISFDLLSIGNLFLLCLLMIIGASPSGTGGGLKITLLATVYAHMKSSFQGMHKTVLGNTIIPANRVRLALAIFTFYVLTLSLSTLILTYLYPYEDFEKIVFEAISAFSTVGLTMGLTYKLGIAGKALLIITMFIGRIGFLTLGGILFWDNHNDGTLETNDIAI
jgi:trk system potassium uptake protein TrkH